MKKKELENAVLPLDVKETEVVETPATFVEKGIIYTVRNGTKVRVGIHAIEAPAPCGCEDN